MSDPLQAISSSPTASSQSAEARALAAIAHEVRNPLQVLSDLLYLLETSKDPAASAQWLTQAQREVDRIRQLITGLLEASRQTSFQSDFELSEIVEECLASLQEKIDVKKITVHKRFDCRGDLQSSPVEVRVLYQNILANALEAVAPGGLVTVHLSASCDWKDTARRGCRLVIIDNGGGISPADLSHIFEPFFTTKPLKGTGIGLWVVHRIVQKHSGTIHVRSSARAGTAFSIFLPTKPSVAAKAS